VQEMKAFGIVFQLKFDVFGLLIMGQHNSYRQAVNNYFGGVFNFPSMTTSHGITLPLDTGFIRVWWQPCPRGSGYR